MGTHPLACREVTQLSAFEAARSIANDLVGRRACAQASLLDPAGELAILALDPLLVDEQGELLFKRELLVWRQSQHLAEALGQRVELHLGQLVNRLVDGHGFPFDRSSSGHARTRERWSVVLLAGVVGEGGRSRA